MRVRQNATVYAKRVIPARANALNAKNRTILEINVNMNAVWVVRTGHAIIPLASVLRAVMGISEHSVICHAAPPVCQKNVARKMGYVVHVRIKHRMVTSVTNHVVIRASTVNVNEMANVHQGVLPTTTDPSVSSCARKTALRP